MQRQPRNLSFLKCARCRKDRQKCTPLGRSWPSQRCDRCIKFDYPCSANLTAREQSQRFLQALEPAEFHENVQGWMSSSASVTRPPISSNIPFTAEFTASEKPYSPLFPGDMSNNAQPTPNDTQPTSNSAQPTPKCAELFSALKEAGWNYQQQLKCAESEPESSPEYSIKFGLSMIMKLPIMNIHAMLKHREHLIRFHQIHRQVVEENIANGFPRKKAERLSIADFILTISRKAEDEEDESATDFILSLIYMLREGSRWQELIDAVAAPEILLIGPLPGEKYCEEDSDDHETEIPSVGSLEKDFHKDYKSMDIIKIIKSGDDDVFAKMKELLLIPDLQLKETCQRLSGVLKLITRLGEVEENFEPEDIISLRKKEPAKPKEGGNSELVSSLGSEIQQRIREVLWKPDSGFESEVESLLSKVASLVIVEAQRQVRAKAKGDDKETSSNDDGSEVISGSNFGDRTQDFDDDFCVQFLNNDAFS